MARITALRLDTRELDRLGVNLGEIAGEELGRVVVTSLNEVVDTTYELARGRMISDINLSDPYLRKRMEVVHATSSEPVASIRASGAREDLTVLGRFDAKPTRIVPVTSRGRKKGNRALGITPGQKPLGVSVQVRRGAEGQIERGFLMPLRRGAESGGNGLGVFARDRSGKLRHRYGPSVYQLFAYQVVQILDETAVELAETIADNIEATIQKALRE